MRLRRLWNGLRWGSMDGPAIIIDWDRHKITFARMPRRTAARMVVWLSRGDREKIASP